MKNTLLTFCFSIITMFSFAGTITVQNTNDSGTGSLRDAVTNSVSGDTVRFNSNLISTGSNTIVLLSEINFVKNLVFKGLYNANDTLYISGNNSNRIFYVDFSGSAIANQAITIDSLALINGAATGNGGAIYFKHGDSLVVHNSLIEGNTASSAGGAIYIYAFSSAPESITITINNSTISGNTASTSGGGIYANSNSNDNFSIITVNNSTIIGNTANSGSGAGIYSNTNSNTANYSTVFVGNSTISGNIATSGFGGGIHSQANSNASNAASTVTVINCTINGNSSYASGGGGIYSKSSIVDYNSNAISVSDVTIDNCDISGNVGSGVYSQSTSGDYYATSASSIVTVNKSTINGNTSTAGGGIASIASAVYTGFSINSTIVLDSTTISGNTTSAAGGGIYSKSSSHSTVTADESTISGNSSSFYGGGGIYSHCKNASTVTLDNSTISENTAIPFGGGIYSYADLAAYSSGSISSVNLSKCTLFGNSATDDGGGVYSDSYFNTSEVILENTTIYGNTAVNDGEGIYSTGPISRIWPKSCIVAHNGVNNIFNNSSNTIASLGYNIFSDAPNGYDLTNDQINIDLISLNLLPIANNGGFTQTMLPGTGSFAINMGDPVDLSDAQNEAIYGIRDVGAAEVGCKSYALNEVVSCESYTWLHNGQTYFNDTIINDTVIDGNVNGCDSILTLSLDIKNVNSSMSSIVACSSYTWSHNGQNYVSDTIATDTIIGAGTFGCDSIVILNLIIEDVTLPLEDLASLPDITNECSVVMPTAPTATDNCAGSITGTTVTIFPISVLGTTVVIWEYDDGNGNVSSQTQNVIVTDVTPPAPDLLNLSDVNDECEVTLNTPTATDNCTGAITGVSDVTFPITASGTTTVTWTYDDGNGNISTQTQDVIIEDLTSPAPDLMSLLDLNDECEITPTAPTATDNCAGAITGTPDVTFPITASGTTTVTWTYDDGNGNISTQMQDVIITPIDNGITQIDAITLSANAAGYNYQWVDCDNGNNPVSGATSQSFTPAVAGSYACQIDNGTCTVTTACLTSSVGILENGFGSALVVYPNPTFGNLKVDLGNVYNRTTVKVFNAFGQVVIDASFGATDEIELNIEGLPGLYILEIKTEEGKAARINVLKQ